MPYRTLILTLAIACIGSCTYSYAQHAPESPLSPTRSNPCEPIAPFYHGVASGDPLADRVIIWTRITTDSLLSHVDWRVATDTAMTQIVQQGSTTTDASKDYTVKIDVTGLQPNTIYYYEFSAEQHNSIRGRTRTTPTAVNTDSLRFAVASCGSYGSGYFNVYRQITKRNDLFGVLFLGDYIYEYGDGEFGNVRTESPLQETLTLEDYRMRHSHYKLDADMRGMLQQYPIIAVWDDHEIANDGWTGGAENHDTNTEGDWFVRRNGALQAYLEWMPVRLPSPQAHPQRIYRRFQFGDLIDLYMLDTRYEARAEQDGTNNTDPSHVLLGTEQFDWLVTGMDNSNARWQLLGQQVMMAPLTLAGFAFNADQWDGYSTERGNLYGEVINRGIQNMVVLTGDIHTTWANDLPMANYNANTGANSAGAEFITPSATSFSLPFPVGATLIKFLNPHMKHVDLTNHGYFVLDVNQQRTQADWFFVPTIDQPNDNQSWNKSFYTSAGTRYIREANQPTLPSPDMVRLQAPCDPRPWSIPSGVHSVSNDAVLLGLYPNPSHQDVTIQFYLRQQSDVHIQLVDVTGRVWHSQTIKDHYKGIDYLRIETQDIPNGTYFVLLQTAQKTYQRTLIKQ
jgi:alkaline phosphatase D